MKKRFLTVALIGTAGVAWIGCSDDSAANPPGPDSGEDAGSSGAPAVDAGDGATPDDGGDSVGPAITHLAFIENPNNLLSGYLEFETDKPATVAVRVTTQSESFEVASETTADTTHSIRILGLHAEETFSIELTATDAAGNTTEAAVPHTTGPLPDGFPPVRMQMADAERMAPGVTFFNVFRWAPGADTTWGLLLAVDEKGRIVWYHTADHRIGDARRLSNGHFLYLFGNDGAVEIDVMGEEIQRWTHTSLGVDSLHHEIYQLPGGNFVTLGSELRSIDGYEMGTVTHNVVGDTIHEFEPSGSVVSTWKLLDLLDPLRVRPGFDAPFWDTRYPDASGGTKDWSHANAVIYDESDDSLIVSARHQDWLVKISRSTGELIWRFGMDGDFTLSGDGEFPFHAHAPELQANGNLLVYDNGNARPTPMGAPLFSRAVEFSLDTSGDTWTAEQVWEFRNEAYYAPFLGDADKLANGNVLITDGGLLSDPSLAPDNPDNFKTARIVEVTGASAPEVVFELTIDDSAAVDAVGYSIYRAERLTRLYP